MALSPLARRASSIVLVLAIALLAAGCINFNGSTSATQVAASGDIGTTLRYEFSICSDSLDDGTCNPHTGISATRLMAGILVPVGSTAPDTVTGTLSEPISVTRDGASAMRSDLRAFRSTQFAADLTREQAPPTGSMWVGYISEYLNVGNGTTPNGTVRIDVTLERDQVGNPGAGTAVRQVAITESDNYLTGNDPAPGETDTLGFNCWEDADADGTPEREVCIDEVDPATPQTVALRRLTLTGASSSTVTEAGAAATTSPVLRLDGPDLPSSAVAITTSVVGAGLTASAPATVTAVSGSNVAVPVTLTAAKGAQPGTLTVTARTSNGSVRTAIVPVNVLSDDDGTRPSTTISARRLAASGALRFSGQATDQNRSAGLTSVRVQAIRGLGKGRCVAWTGTKLVREACATSLQRWFTLPLTIDANTTSVDWTTTTPVAEPGLWLLRARAHDGDGLVSRVSTARVTVLKPRTAARTGR